LVGTLFIRRFDCSVNIRIVSPLTVLSQQGRPVLVLSRNAAARQTQQLLATVRTRDIRIALCCFANTYKWVVKKVVKNPITT
jgi:hypothetical protein